MTSWTTRAIFGLALILVGCTSLTPAGERVRVTSNTEAVRGCTLLGEVRGEDRMWGGVAGQGIAENNAWNELKNRAAQMGADVVLLVTSSTGFSGARTIGEAYRCAVDPARADVLSRITISNFERKNTTDGSLVGSFDLLNSNDVAISSLVVECSISGVTARTAAALPALGPHQRVTVNGIAFGGLPFPDGAPTCRGVTVNPLR